MRAAVENGADGVYFGLDDFNARLRAPNFTLRELPELVAWLHERGVRAYVTLNTLAFSDELDQVALILRACSDAGVDGVMVQDVGVAYLANRLVPELPIHASTQMTLTAPESFAAIEQLGIKLWRVVAPRELDVAQLADLVRGISAEVEVFVHGALCVAYSGQCLTSEALGGRSANRGECAQACRLPYDLIVDGKLRDTGDIKYLLSPKDLAAYSDIPRLAAIGVKSLKIEGRLKSPEYVAATTQAYRHALEQTVRQESVTELPLDEATRYRLEMVFSRGFTGGYLHRIDHQAVVEGRYPKKRGPYLGRVVAVSHAGVTVDLVAPLALGDGIVFDAGRPDLEEVGGRVYSLTVKGRSCQSIGADTPFPCRATLRLGRDKFDTRRIHVGDRVWKTSDPRLENELAHTYKSDQPRWRRGLHARLSVRVGAPAELTLVDHWGICVTVSDDLPAEPPQDRALTSEVAHEQLGRLGNTPFFLQTLDFDVPEPVFVPLSRLNALRRRAVEELIAARRSLGQGRQVCERALEDIRAEINSLGNAGVPTVPQLNVLCRTLEQVEIAAAHECVSTVYTDFENLRWHAQAAEIIRGHGKRFVPATLRIMKPREHNLLRAVLSAQPDAVLVRNLAAWHLVREWKPSLEIIGDYPLNIANDVSAWLLKKAGFSYLTPSYDLNGEQLLQLLQRVPAGWFEVTIHQHMPMFHMEHCVFCRFLSNGTDYTNCGRPCDFHRVALRDRMNFAHPVKADAGCRNTVYNAVPQSAAEYVPQLLEAGVRRFRLEFIEEDSMRTREAIDAYAQLLAGKKPAPQVWRELKALSKVGVTRGTLDHV
jgi:putative protease